MMGATLSQSRGIGILFVITGMFCISVNDMLIKTLSDAYPAHQIVFFRTSIGILLSFVFLQFEGGWRQLRTSRPGLHALRALLVVFANLVFYAAIVAMPLATAYALYFVAPLFVTLLAIPVLGETVGPRRILAVLIGFCGVLIILMPEIATQGEGPGWLALLPMMAAAGYAGMSVLTRKLGPASPASALAIYLQLAFLAVSLTFYVVAGDGRFAPEAGSDSLMFLLRAWVWPDPADTWALLGLGLLSAVIGYTMSQAYRLTNASVVAPFEYVLLVFALFWGWTIFGEWPAPTVFVGAAVIIGSSLYIAWRERRRQAMDAGSS